MQLQKITEQNSEQYQAFVQTKGIFLQDFVWGDFQKAQGKDVYRYALLNGEGEIIAAAQFLENKALGFRYLYAPYGPVLKDADEQALHLFLEEVHQLHPKITFIRVEPRSGQESAAGSGMNFSSLNQSYNLNPHKSLVLDLAKPEQQLLAEMHSKTRYNIKIAQRDGVEVKMHDLLEIPGTNENLLEPIFITTKRAGIRSFPANYYRSLTKYFADPAKPIKTKVFSAWHENDLLATNIVLFYQNTCIYLFGGSANVKRNLMAPYLLQWTTMQKAKEEGYKKYDFWGVEDDPNHPWAGISRFKFGFGGELKKYSGTHDFIGNKAWYNVYSVLRTLNRLIR